MKKWPGNLFQTLFNFQKILIRKDSMEVCKLIWTNFDSFAITYLIKVTCFESLIFR